MRARVKFGMTARAQKVVVKYPVLAFRMGLYHNQQATGPPIGENLVIVYLMQFVCKDSESMASSDTPRNCIFCGKPGNITAEHCFGKWISKLFGKSSYRLRKKTPQGQVIREWEANTINMTACSTCGECNNGWMSQLEAQEAKPLLSQIILHGSPVTLFPNGLTSIAAFAFKGMVVADSMRPGHEVRFFPFSIRRRFSRSLEIPYGVHMWIGAFYSGAGRHGTWNMDYRNGSGPLNGFQFYIFTYAAGWFVLQVVASRWTKNSRRPFPFPILKQDVAWDELAIPFWPSARTPIFWPTRKCLGDDTIKAFSDRWAKLRHPHGTRDLFISN